MRPNRRAVLPLLLLALALASCGGLNESLPAGTGNVSVYLTDAPSYAFDNVWVTVRRVWFHKVETAAFDNTASGWIRFTLDNGATVNLAALSGDNNVVKVFDNLALPAGTYRQMLLFLEPTENARTASATAEGLSFNNQVDAGTLHAALRVPNAAQGIRVADRVFQVDNGALLRLAIDFDVGRDVLPFDRGAVKEFLLQPRPRSFDLDNAGAIVGYIDNTAAADNAALFEVLAERADTALGARVVRRAAAVDNATGRFVLYPLAPGTTPGNRYDIVIRGIGWLTTIVNEVPVTGGTTPGAAPTPLGTALSRIPMESAPAPDFRISATISAPRGALAKFYQRFTGHLPYLVRQANFNPLSGTIDEFPLSTGGVRFDPFNAAEYGGGTINIASPLQPIDAFGGFRLVAEASLYDPSAPPDGGTLVDPSSIFSPVPVAGLTPSAPASSNEIRSPEPGGVTVPQTVAPLDNLVVFATHGGTIINASSLGQVSPVGATVPYSIANLPGGQAGAAFPPAIYGLSAYGWRTGGTDNVLRIATQVGSADLRAGDGIVNINMMNVTGP